ncbi:HD-GYP domain-containing protein [Undibacterium arcticum]
MDQDASPDLRHIVFYETAVARNTLCRAAARFRKKSASGNTSCAKRKKAPPFRHVSAGAAVQVRTGLPGTASVSTFGGTAHTVRVEHGGVSGRKKRKIDENLGGEFERLDEFLRTIRRANEPAISHTEALPELRDVLDYTYHESDGPAARLLDEHEFSALSVSVGCLTEEERRQVQSHVADSYSFLILIPWTRDLAGIPAIAHGHHEKLDGSGYPMGLRGAQINIQTRILTICDIYDALTAADRPYKRAMPVEQALDLMTAECRAGRLDSRLFNVFVESKVWAMA